MPASFVTSLCGYREGRPNTSDKNDKQSIELGEELFTALGVSKAAPAPEGVGNALTAAVESDLATRRPDLSVRHDRPAYEFAQYAHLAALAALRSKGPDSVEARLVELQEVVTNEHAAGRVDTRAFTRISSQLAKATAVAAKADTDLTAIVDQLATESLLKIDVTVAPLSTPSPPRLLLGLSSKWSLRTDRAQDCVSQGSKLVNLRRGRMPHFALITIEPRPAMLALVADGSGSVDAVYHLALPQLQQAVKAAGARKTGRWRPEATLNRLIRQRRLLDYDDLLVEIDQLPS